MNVGKPRWRCRRARLGRVTRAVGVPVLVAATLLATASPAFALLTPLSSAAFTSDSEPANWSIPTVGSGNQSCLTAGPYTSGTSIPDCNPTIDSAGNGTLRFTQSAGDQVGSVFYSVSLPTSEGLDISFQSYQYDGTGADGISFGLAAANPADPTAPASVGYLGGALGYSTNQSAAGVPYGYLGLGLDVYGNYENSAYGGSTCTLPTGLTAGDAYPESVTARGPGDGTTGYCILATTASAYRHTGDGSNDETLNNLGPTQGSGGYYLDNQSATARTGLAVPVEIVINPSSNIGAASSSGLSVPADSWFIAYKPLGATSWQSISGVLPTTSNNTVLKNDFPASWIDPSTGIPYQLTFGWTSSTGGSTEIHEVSGLAAQTLNGAVPVLAIGNTDDEGGALLAGNQAVYTLSPSVTSGSEPDTITLTDAFPSGIVPGTASSASDWSCATAGQLVTCTYAPGSPISGGTALPNVTIPVTVASSASGSLPVVVRISSLDGDPATATDTATVTKLTASASPATVSYGNPVLLSVAGMPASATGTVSFQVGPTTLCTTSLPVLSCDTPSSLIPGGYNVTATYSGDSNYESATAPTSFTVQKSAAYSMTAGASPSSTPYGNVVVLSASGFPGNATGSVTFTSGGSTLCTANLPSPSCHTSAALGGGSYSVMADYSGDSNYVAGSASTSFAITKAPVSTMSASAVPGSVPHGSAVSLSAAGLPGNATGTVSFAAGSETLCEATLPVLSCGTSPTLAAGIYPVTATYSGDNNYAGATAATSFTITMSSDYTMAASASPTPTSYGNAVLVSVSGLPGDATGSVSFKSGSTPLCTTSLPILGCDTSSVLPVGSYPVTATYLGDNNYVGSTASTSFTITKSASYTMTAAAAPDSVPYGNDVVVSVSGLPGDATGSVSFEWGTTNLCTASLPTPSCDTSSSLAAGSYAVTAIYGGDANYEGASASTNFTITKSSAYTLSASTNPGSTAYGNAVGLSAAGIPGDATGTVSFASDGVTLCATTLPLLSCDTSSTLAVDNYSVTATYSGDGNYEGSSAPTGFTIIKFSAYLMTAQASPSETPYGNSVTLVASGLPVSATGTVAFSTGATTLCSAPLLGGTANCATSVSLGADSYTVTATYGGDADNDGSSAQTSFTITQSSGYSMAASASPASTPLGNVVTLSVSGLASDATGTVSFASGTTTLCTTSLPTLSCVTSATLGASTYAVTATYSGDTNYEGSTAGTTFTITRYSNYSMSAEATPPSSAYGQVVTLSVSGIPGAATGTVSFTSNGGQLCTATLPVLSCGTLATLGVGNYPVAASYSGDDTYEGTSATTEFTITKSASYSMAASATPGSAPYGTAVSLSASGLPVDATGAVTFTSGPTTLCSATLTSGSASCSAGKALAPRRYDVTAVYLGDANYEGSSASTGFEVTKSSRYEMNAAASPGSAPYGSIVTLSVSGLPGDATGKVSFTTGTTSICTASLPALHCDSPPGFAVGSYSVTATYSGDSNYAGDSASTTFTVTQLASYPMSASAKPGSAPYGTAVSLAASGLPTKATGTVVFSSGATTLCTGKLKGGKAGCSSSSSLAPGSYSVTATYSGDSNYGGESASTSFTITEPASYSMSASAKPGSAPYGTAISLAASGLPRNATGTVGFRSGTESLCTGNLQAGSAECATSVLLAPGSYSVTATYSGDSNYGGDSAATSFTITKSAAFSLSAAAVPGVTTSGHAVTLSTSGLPGDATGTVSFSSGMLALCTASLPALKCNTSSNLAVGSYPVTATYSGDGNYAGASASTGFSITKSSDYLMTASATPSSVPYGEVVALSVQGLPSAATGSVSFSWHSPRPLQSGGVAGRCHLCRTSGRRPTALHGDRFL